MNLESSSTTTHYSSGDTKLALWAASLYLLNLLLLPVVAYLLLLLLYRHIRQQDEYPLATLHLQQAFRASNWAGVLILSSLLLFWILGADTPTAWVVAIIYFTLIHSTFILLGVVSLSHAFSAKPFRFPFINGVHNDG